MSVTYLGNAVFKNKREDTTLLHCVVCNRPLAVSRVSVIDANMQKVHVHPCASGCAEVGTEGT